MEFNNIYAHSMVRVAAGTFTVIPGNPAANAERIIELMRAAAKEHVAVLVFPQDCLTGSNGAWNANTSLTNASVAAIEKIADDTADLGMLTLIGAHLSGASRAIYIYGDTVSDDVESPHGLRAVNLPGLRVLPVVGAELGSIFDAGVPDATLIAHLTAPAHTVEATKRLARRALSVSEERHTIVVQAIGSAGESSTDAATCAHSFICADGTVLQDEDHLGNAGLSIADVVLPELSYGVRYTGPDHGSLTGFGNFEVNLDLDVEVPLLVPPARRPLVPTSERRYRHNLREAFEIQTAALARRLEAVGDTKIILGVSGGLDSTLAALAAVAAKARRAQRTGEGQSVWRRQILTYSMPGFATSQASRERAAALTSALGLECTTIDIRPAATEMLKALGHPAGEGQPVYDITFENIQAGLRSDYLFRLANQNGGFVLGTGDLSELALGWCTYGVGDHMSHYAINAGVPKSLMRDLILEATEVLSENLLLSDETALRDVLAQVLDADISPELIPGEGDGAQTTEGTIGPYELHDFFLYHTLKGAGPQLVAFLAQAAFGTGTEGETKYSRSEIHRWLKVFYRRFITQQFKRSALPDGPVIWEGMTLSPRAGFQFPSDLSADAVLAQLSSLS